MRSLTFIILIISKFKFVPLIVVLKSRILTFIFFWSSFLIVLDFFQWKHLNFIKWN